jgi:hypothetical protein
MGSSLSDWLEAEQKPENSVSYNYYVSKFKGYTYKTKEAVALSYTLLEYC